MQEIVLSGLIFNKLKYMKFESDWIRRMSTAEFAWKYFGEPCGYARRGSRISVIRGN
jgi:hypothetical protein